MACTGGYLARSTSKIFCLVLKKIYNTMNNYGLKERCLFLLA